MGTMKETDYGKRVMNGLRAINSMHTQVRLLFKDCDSLFRGYRSLYGNIATREVSGTIQYGPWMTQGAYRFWHKPSEPVPAITVILFSEEDSEILEEPVFVAGLLKYRVDVNENSDQRWWDLWKAFFDWAPVKASGKVFSLDGPARDVEWARIVAVPLFSLEGLADVKSLFAQLGFSGR